MKYVAFAIIGAVAALMGWLWFEPECAGGFVVRDVADCSKVPEFGNAFCSRTFERQAEAIRRAGGLFLTRDACLQRHTTCIDLPADGGQAGYAARPAGFCIVRGAEGGLSRMIPVYRGP